MNRTNLIKVCLEKETISKKPRIVRILENVPLILEETLLTLDHSDLIEIIESLSKIETQSAPMKLAKPDYTSMTNSFLINIIFSFFNNPNRNDKRNLECILTLDSFDTENFVNILLEWNANALNKHNITKLHFEEVLEELNDYLSKLLQLKTSNFSQNSCVNMVQYYSTKYTVFADICNISNISKFITRRDNLKYCLVKYLKKKISYDELKKEVDYQYDYMCTFIDEFNLFDEKNFLLALLITDICPRNDRYLKVLNS